MIRMYGMGIIGRNHKTSGGKGHNLIHGISKGLAQAEYRIYQECGAGAFIGAASDFLVVEQYVHAYVLILL